MVMAHVCTETHFLNKIKAWYWKLHTMVCLCQKETVSVNEIHIVGPVNKSRWTFQHAWFKISFISLKVENIIYYSAFTPIWAPHLLPHYFLHIQLPHHPGQGHRRAGANSHNTECKETSPRMGCQSMAGHHALTHSYIHTRAHLGPFCIAKHVCMFLKWEETKSSMGRTCKAQHSHWHELRTEPETLFHHPVVPTYCQSQNPHLSFILFFFFFTVNHC